MLKPGQTAIAVVFNATLSSLMQCLMTGCQPVCFEGSSVSCSWNLSRVRSTRAECVPTRKVCFFGWVSSNDAMSSVLGVVGGGGSSLELLPGVEALRRDARASALHLCRVGPWCKHVSVASPS